MTVDRTALPIPDRALGGHRPLDVRPFRGPQGPAGEA